MEVPKAQNQSRHEKERFGRQRKALLKKIQQVNRDGAKVFMVIERYGTHYTYNSESCAEWLPLNNLTVGILFMLFTGTTLILCHRQDNCSIPNAKVLDITVRLARKTSGQIDGVKEGSIYRLH